MRNEYVFSFVDGRSLYQRFNKENTHPSENPFKRIKYLDVARIKSERHFICCTLAGRLIASLAIQPSPLNPKAILVNHISVDQDFRNLGIATLLIDNCLSYAAEASKSLEFSSFSDEGKMFLKPVIRRLQKKHPAVEITLTDPLDFEGV